MKYTEFVKSIKTASSNQDGLVAYIASWGKDKTVCNFITGDIDFEHIVKAEKAGLLICDWDTWIVA